MSFLQGDLRETRLPDRPQSAETGVALWFREAGGAVADLGVLVPIAVALIVSNGLSPTAVLLPAGLAYLLVARVYRVPVAVQPLKAFGAVAIAAGVGADVVAAGALLMGVMFLGLGFSGLLDRVAAMFPQPVIRGVQLAVGLTFVKIAWGLVSAPPAQFHDQLSPVWLGIGALAVFAALLIWRKGLILVVIVASLVLAAIMGGDGAGLGPSAIQFPALSFNAFATAAVLLVLPQLPLTFANSCLAPADAARAYFGAAAEKVTPGRLARTLGLSNLFAGAISGMPVCHGAGGMSAHYTFGARTGRAPLIIGVGLLVAAIGFGAALAVTLTAFPLSVLAALLGVAAVAHVMLLKDLRGAGPWALALSVGVIGVLANLALSVVGGLLAYAAWTGVQRLRAR